MNQPHTCRRTPASFLKNHVEWILSRSVHSKYNPGFKSITEGQSSSGNGISPLTVINNKLSSTKKKNAAITKFFSFVHVEHWDKLTAQKQMNAHRPSKSSSNSFFILTYALAYSILVPFSSALNWVKNRYDFPWGLAEMKRKYLLSVLRVCINSFKSEVISLLCCFPFSSLPPLSRLSKINKVTQQMHTDGTH